MFTQFSHYWGKAQPEGGGPLWHPLAYHCLDVAAVVSVYLERNPSVRNRLGLLLGCSPQDAQQLAVFLGASHDVGKFGVAFQAKAPEVFAVLFPQSARPAETSPHSEIGLSTLLEYLGQRWLPHAEIEDACAFLEPLANAACGHHGRPESPRKRPLGGASGAAANAYLTAMSSLFNVSRPPFLDDSEPQRLKNASWLLAGIITLCDWIGSSQAFFPYQPPTLALADYWEGARARAADAVAQCSLDEKEGSAHCGFDWLFGQARSQATGGQRPKTPTPLQSFVDRVPLPDKPQPLLFILEDETGAGKTEAALTLASRLIGRKFARGLLFSLPTQTTANAVFDRVAPLAPLFFEAGQTPTTTLAHGQAKLALSRLQSQGAQAATISGELNAWAQESAKTALLSDVGVGTVDQVAMAGLPIRHVVLRQLGLAQKVLIVDEAHACEPYLLDILKNTLTQHARLGGSAIILSATLPQATKQELLDAFARGLGLQKAASLTETAYPLATSFWAGHLGEQPVAARKAPRRLTLRAIDEAGALAKIQQWLREGRSVCLMRNTVGAAQAAYDFFQSQFPGQICLVHARFMLGHRASNDQALLQNFGKDSTSVTRAGRLVIATQVAEQSLDVDFDEMVTDLAPLDSLLQREGRRRRHRRDAAGNPAMTEARSSSALYVITPPVGTNEYFLEELSPGTPYVYPMPGVLYRTAEIVHQWQVLQIPQQVRQALEYAYDPHAQVPDFLLDKEDRSHGQTLAARQHARVSMLRLACGYSVEAGIDLAERSVTRLGEPSVQVVLCDERGRPLLGTGFEAKALSQVSLRASLVGESCADDGRVYLTMRKDVDGFWRAPIRDGRGNRYIAEYSPERGFSMVRA